MIEIKGKIEILVIDWCGIHVCWDNAVMENWNGMLKTEWYCHPRLRRDKKPISPEQAMKEIRAYIDYWNNDRILARLKYRSPKEFKEAISQNGV